jgi:hypothetical protein
MRVVVLFLVVGFLEEMSFVGRRRIVVEGVSSVDKGDRL